MSLSTPTQIDVPFADLGTRTAIPAAANNTTGRAGYDLGFPPINSTPKVAGGIPPFGSDMNGILYDITVAEQFIQAGGSWPYDSAFATAIGGYPLGALVQRSDSSGFWRNTLDGNTTDPDAGGANWQPEEAGITSVTMTSSNVTLTSLEAARNIIVITGTLTTNLNLIFPTYTKNWTVSNQTTGAFTITCKTAAGAGFAPAQGSSPILFGNGTDIKLAGQSGGLLNVQVFDSAGSSTYTPTAGTQSVIVEVCGAGAGSGGCAATGGGQVSMSGGGGSGAYAKSRITSGFSGVSVVVGAAGAAGAAAGNGGDGGQSSFGTVVAAGGIGSVAGIVQTAPGGQGGGTGGATPSVGNIVKAAGCKGDIGYSFTVTTPIGGTGGNSFFGGGGGGGGPGAVGFAGNAPGAGAGGSSNLALFSARVGAVGAAGIVIVYEYS